MQCLDGEHVPAGLWSLRESITLLTLAAVVLSATAGLTLPETLAGFGDPAVILIAALFVVSEGLDATGVTTRVEQELVNRRVSGMGKFPVLTMLLAASLTALIGLNGTREKPSKLSAYSRSIKRSGWLGSNPSRRAFVGGGPCGQLPWTARTGHCNLRMAAPPGPETARCLQELHHRSVCAH